MKKELESHPLRRETVRQRDLFRKLYRIASQRIEFDMNTAVDSARVSPNIKVKCKKRKRGHSQSPSASSTRKRSVVETLCRSIQNPHSHSFTLPNATIMEQFTVVGPKKVKPQIIIVYYTNIYQLLTPIILQTIHSHHFLFTTLLLTASVGRKSLEQSMM